MKIEGLDNVDIHKELGRRLKQARRNSKMSQTFLAEQSGICRRTLVAAEQGDGATLETLFSILRGLKKLSELDGFLSEPAQKSNQTPSTQSQASTKPHATKPRRPHAWSWE